MGDDSEWFAPRRYGIGSGPPVRWQGWAVLGAYLVLLGLASLVIRYSWAGYVSIVTMLTACLMVICARTTKGGWRWRWGDSDDD